MGGASHSLHCCFGSRNPFSIARPSLALVPPPSVPNLDSVLASPSSFLVSRVLGKGHLTPAITNWSELRSQITMPGVKPAGLLNPTKETVEMNNGIASQRVIHSIRNWSLYKHEGPQESLESPGDEMKSPRSVRYKQAYQDYQKLRRTILKCGPTWRRHNFLVLGPICEPFTSLERQSKTVGPKFGSDRARNAPKTFKKRRLLREKSKFQYFPIPSPS